MSDITFGFIGAGNMGGALARAVCRTVDADRVFVSDYLPEKALALAEELGCTATDNSTVAQRCDYVFLGVKPQMMAQMLGGIAPLLAARGNGVILVSMAAGLSMAQIAEMAGGQYPIIRIMPNTPAAVGEGMILVTANDAVGPEQLARFEAAMAKAGMLDRIDEHLIDAASAVSGCGPAYVYLFMEALADGGVACGLPRDKAMRYAAQTVLGAAKTLLETGRHPGRLKDAVCSPGGTTIEGVQALENAGFRAAAMNAVRAAYHKTKALL